MQKNGMNSVRSAVLAAIAGMALASGAMADWSANFLNGDPVPTADKFGVSTLGDPIGGADIRFNTDTSNALTVAFLGTTGLGTEASTGVAVVTDAGIASNAVVTALVNPDGATLGNRAGVMVRFDSGSTTGYAVVVDYTTGNLVIATLNTGTATYTTLDSQPIPGHATNATYFVRAVASGTSINATVAATAGGTPLVSASATGLAIASGSHGLAVRSDAQNVATTATFGTVSASALNGGGADFDGDGEDDYLWYNPTTGEVWWWSMNDDAINSATQLPTIGTGWTLVGTGDFNDDDFRDVLWQNVETDQTVIWVGGASGFTPTELPFIDAETWRAEAVADLSSDGKADIIWRAPATGDVWSWTMDGTTISSAQAILSVPTGWAVRTATDTNNDGFADLVFRNDDGSAGVLSMNGSTPTAWTGLPFAGTDWNIVGSNDFNDDGNRDLLWQNGTTGEVFGWQLDGANALSGSGAAPSAFSPWLLRN